MGLVPPLARLFKVIVGISGNKVRNTIELSRESGEHLSSIYLLELNKSIQWELKSASHLNLDDFLYDSHFGYTSTIMASWSLDPCIRLFPVLFGRVRYFVALGRSTDMLLFPTKL